MDQFQVFTLTLAIIMLTTRVITWNMDRRKAAKIRREIAERNWQTKSDRMRSKMMN